MLRLTQLPAELAADATAQARLTQIVAEVVADLPILSNCRVSQLAIEVVVSVCQKTQIVGGNFQDSGGNVLAGGTVCFQVSADARTCNGAQISGGRRVSVTLDQNGSIPSSPPFFLWPNDSLSNKYKTLVYLMSVFDARGQLAIQKQVTVPAFTDVWDIAS